MSEAPFVSEQKEPKGAVSDLREWTMGQAAIGKCLFCPDWKCSGTVEEIEQHSLAHRLEFHPNNLKTSRRKRPNLGRWRNTLDEDTSQEVTIERTRRMRLLGIPEDT